MIDEELYELKQRLEWFINGIGIHCISWDLFHVMTADNICRLYNVDPSYFKTEKNG